jgi:chromosome partitioning protein
MPNNIAIIGAKGGTGKSTTALNLAVALAEQGQQVLLTELDSQNAMAHGLSQKSSAWGGLRQAMAGTISWDEALVPTHLPGLVLLPYGDIAPWEVIDFEKQLYESDHLREALWKLSAKFSYLLIDTPSGVGGAVQAALTTCQYVLIPLQAEPLALRVVEQSLALMEHLKGSINSHLELLGFLVTMVQLHEDACLNVLSNLWAASCPVLETLIPRSPVFLTASERGVPVGFLKGKTSVEAQRFQMLAMEIENLIKQKSGEEDISNERPERTLV